MVCIKFFADSSGVTTHAIQLTDPINVAHPLITQIQLNLSIAGYENDHTPNLLLKNLQSIHQQKNIQNVRPICKIIKISSYPARGLMFVNTVVLYTLACDTNDVKDYH